jgi:membrane-associated PAP2 superfamily phosphatase
VIGRRRRSLHEDLLEQDARIAPDAETAEQRLARVARKPIVLGTAAVATLVVIKIVAKVAGIEFLRHPSWAIALVVLVAVGLWITMVRLRRETTGADDE